MNRNAEILNELRALGSPLADMPAEMPFATPQGYFERLAAELTSGAALPVAPEGVYISKAAKEMAFNVPAGYFETLPASLLNAAKAADTNPEKSGRVISLQPALKRLSKVAAAAVLALGIGFGSYHYLNSVKTPDTAALHALSELEVDTIASYVAQNIESIDTEVLIASVTEASPEDISFSSLEATEIQEYLEEAGDTVLPAINNETL